MKMLRVLQEREFERIGDTRTIKVDVRIVAATNADLSKMVKEGTFREDLYYRLNVIPVHIAPLRERIEDIPLLVQTFMKKFAPRSGRVTVSQDAMRRLMAYAWPGNVRQLENAIERAIAMSGSRTQIEVGDLPADLQATGEAQRQAGRSICRRRASTCPRSIAQIEKDMIERALARTEQNKGAAARLLGLKRTTLVEKLKRLLERQRLIGLIGEDRHVLRLPHQQIERRRAARLVDRRLKHRQLSRPDRDQPDLLRLQHESQRQRQSPRRRLRRILDRHRAQVVLRQRLVSRETASRCGRPRRRRGSRGRARRCPAPSPAHRRTTVPPGRGSLSAGILIARGALAPSGDSSIRSASP